MQQLAAVLVSRPRNGTFLSRFRPTSKPVERGVIKRTEGAARGGWACGPEAAGAAPPLLVPVFTDNVLLKKREQSVAEERSLDVEGLRWSASLPAVAPTTLKRSSQKSRVRLPQRQSEGKP